MSQTISLLFNTQRQPGSIPAVIDYASAQAARIFHRTLPGYAATPLHTLPQLSRQWGLGSIMVKDEAPRFGLNAFKGLGASFAVAQALSHQLGLADGTADFAALQQALRQPGANHPTLITATDGNHGRGVAWAAQQLGIPAVVLMPAGSSPQRAAHIRSHGAQCTITELNYDDTVRLASEQAAAQGWLLVQDTAWPGYEQVPQWIMQGYATLVAELAEQWAVPPTHVILQAGVGSFAAAVAACLHDVLAESPPHIVIVEPQQAACLYRSAEAGDGRPHAVSGRLDTIMAGLACGEPSTLAWPWLRDHVTVFARISDHICANGMRILAAPRPGGDPAIVAGESGAAGMGLLHALCQRSDCAAIRAQLKLDQQANVLLINTEGDTDPAMYQAVIWNGRYGETGVES